MSSAQKRLLKPLIFATASSIRREIVEAHGINCEFVKSDVDEELIKINFKGIEFNNLAMQLATEKALTVSDIKENYYVVGVDQVCAIDGEVLNKPENSDNAFLSLKKLSGRSHFQNCGMAICLNGKILWQSFSTAELTMKSLSDQEIHDYIKLDEPFSCSGSYKFESYGKELFTNVLGTEYTIQGLDIDKLLDVFVEEGIIE